MKIPAYIALKLAINGRDIKAFAEAVAPLEYLQDDSVISKLADHHPLDVQRVVERMVEAAGHIYGQ